MQRELKQLSTSKLAQIIELQVAVSKAGFKIDTVWQTAAEKINNLLGFDGTVIEIVDGDYLEYKAVSGPLVGHALHLRLPIESSLSGYVINHKKMQNCANVELDHRVNIDACRRLGIKSMLVMPLLNSANDGVGVIKIVSSKKNAFTEEDEFLIGLISETLSSMLVNAESVSQELERKTKDLKILSDAIENSINAFDIIDENGKFIFVNKSYLRMWGYDSAEEILGSSPAGHCQDPNIPVKIITDLKNTGECTIEFEAKRKNGSTFNVLMFARKAYDVDGREIYPTTSIDISETKAYEQQLKNAIRMRDEFMSIASHELNTPLTTLKLVSQYRLKQLEKDELTVSSLEKLKEQYVSEVRQIERLSVLVNDMLDITRINTGKLILQKEEFNLNELIAEAIKNYRLKDGSPLIHFHSSLTKNVCLDRFRIEQVINNLLSNAVKYGEGKPVTINLSAKAGDIILQIKDQGIGIAKEAQEKIFQRFERAVSGTEISGLGLGLYIVKEIVNRHNGSISVDSEPGKGSTFELHFPL